MNASQFYLPLYLHTHTHTHLFYPWKGEVQVLTRHLKPASTEYEFCV